MRLEKLPICLQNGYDDDSIVYSSDDEFFYNKDVSQELIEDLKNNNFQVYTGYYSPMVPKWEIWKAKQPETKPTIYLIGRGIKSGKQKVKIEGFLPYCYISDTNGEYITYLGDRVKKLVFDCNPAAVGEFRRNLEEKKSIYTPLEADVPFIRRFLCDTNPSFKPNDIIEPKIAIFDVETDFPNSDDLISFSINYNGEIYHNSKYKTSSYEDLVMDLYNRLIEYDIVTGWNVKFDVDTLNRELKKLGTGLYINNEVAIIDLLSIVPKMVGRQIKGSWSLENAGKQLTDVEKVSIDCYPRDLDEKKLEEYNNQDVVVPYKIDKIYGALECHIILSWLTHCTIEDTEITSVVNDIAMLTAYHKANKVLNSKPPWSMKPKEGEARYKAADPKARPGVYSGIMAFDIKHCLSEDTEVLTPSGWKKRQEVNIGDNIYSFNCRGFIEKDKVIDKTFYKYVGDMISIKNRTIDQLVTPNHRVLYQEHNRNKLTNNYNTWSSYKEKYAEDIVGGNIRIPTSFKLKDRKDYLIDDDLIKLIGWIITEGSNEKGCNGVHITQANADGVKKLNKIFNNLTEKFEFNYRIKYRDDKGYYDYYIKSSEDIRQHFDNRDIHLIPRWMI